MTRFLVPLPAPVERALLSAHVAWSEASAAHDWDLGFATMKALYYQMLRAQPEGARFHKGLPLQHMGQAIISGGGGSMEDALQFTTMAFLEDALSHGDENPGELDELAEAAAQNLVYVFSVPGPMLVKTALAARALQDSPQLVTNPRELLRRSPVTQLLLSAQLDGRLPGQMHSAWERRVFLGGSYSRPYLDRLKSIRDGIEDLGWDGVIALDFAVPGEMSWATHAMMLLHECSAALFDMSVGGGHEAEFVATPTYRIPEGRILLVVDSKAPPERRVSGATRDDWEARGLRPVPYEATGDLLVAVRGFLEALPTASRRRT